MRKPQNAEQKYEDMISKWEGKDLGKKGQFWRSNIQILEAPKRWEKTKAENSIEFNTISNTYKTGVSTLKEDSSVPRTIWLKRHILKCITMNFITVKTRGKNHRSNPKRQNRWHKKDEEPKWHHTSQHSTEARRPWSEAFKLEKHYFPSRTLHSAKIYQFGVKIELRHF